MQPPSRVARGGWRFVILEVPSDPGHSMTLSRQSVVVRDLDECPSQTRRAARPKERTTQHRREAEHQARSQRRSSSSQGEFRT